MNAPRPNFGHLLSLSGPYGTFEHANHAVAREEHGYCTDDVSRVLLVIAREPDPSQQLLDLERSSLEFLRDAQSGNGRFRNRRLPTGKWQGPSTDEDCWGRSIWALGTVMARSPDGEVRDIAREMFERALNVRSTWVRSTAFAILGASEVLAVNPAHDGSIQFLNDVAKSIDRRALNDDWSWPEPRLTYANAVLPDSVLAVGSFTGDDELIETALLRLRWLLEVQMSNGHLSLTPVGGWGPGEPKRNFDQQPIEAATIADACVRAFDVTAERLWFDYRDLAVQWFLGANDTGSTMFDPETGGGYDGLTANGPNMNQGAESTIAFLTTMQHARQLAPAL